VRRRFAGGLGAVVAADTVAADVEVIEVRRQPGDAAVPSWQEPQVPLTAAWSMTEIGLQAQVVWQSAQEPLLFT
jgi:hypothetical protein